MSRFMSLFMFITVKTTLKISIIKIITKNLKKIKTVLVFAFMFITIISTFKVSVIKNISEKRFN